MNSARKTDKRAYTFMIVPHRGDKTYSWNLPILTIKRAMAALLCVLLLMGGVQLRHMFVVWQARDDQAELAQLRANRASQEEKVRALAKITENMQTEMDKVNQLELEVRRSLGTEEGGVSRSGVARDSRRRPMTVAANVDDVIARAGYLNELAVQKQAALTTLNGQLVERNAIRAATPSIWPAQGEVTSRFGLRVSPDGIGSSGHKGLDIAGAYGSAVCATAEGVVDMATYYYGYGLYVRIDHGYGMKTAYGHNSELKVSVGQRVKKGQTVALMGNSGVSTGTHVHYEVIKNGEPVNPEKFL